METKNVEQMIGRISIWRIILLLVLVIFIAVFSLFIVTSPNELWYIDRIHLSLFKIFFPLFWLMVYSVIYGFPIWLIVICILFMKFFRKIVPFIEYLHKLMIGTKLIDRCKFTSIVIFYNIPILVTIGLFIEVNILSMLVGIGAWWILILLLVSVFRKMNPVLQKWIIAWLILKQLLSILSLSLLDITVNNLLYDLIIEPIGDNLYGWGWCFVRGGNEDFFPMFLGVLWNGVFILLFSLVCGILIKNIGFLRKRFLDI